MLLAVSYCGLVGWGLAQGKREIDYAALIYNHPLLAIPLVYLLVQIPLAFHKRRMPAWSSWVTLFVVLGLFAQVANLAADFIRSGQIGPSIPTREASPPPSGIDREQERLRAARAMQAKEEEEAGRMASEVFRNALPAEFVEIGKGIFRNTLSISDDYGDVGFKLSGELANTSLSDLEYPKFKLSLFDESGKAVLTKEFVVPALPRRMRTKFSVVVPMAFKLASRYSIAQVGE
jgi:hypothetical protein